MLKSNYEVQVLVKWLPIKEYIHDSKIYVEGREGTTFSLRLKNNSGERKLFVPSIDGLSVMNGEECGFDSSGYIVGPYSAITIDGWRVSDKEVAKFYFSSPEDSYGKRIKKGDNLGVIGVAVFSEKEPFWPKDVNKIGFPYHGHDYNRTYWKWDSNGMDIVTLKGTTTCGIPNCSTSNADYNYVSQSLGTGWGETKRSEVVSVDFRKKESPDAIFEIYYNTRAQLEKMGINFKEPVYVTPQAFPGRYCRPPEK